MHASYDATSEYVPVSLQSCGLDSDGYNSRAESVRLKSATDNSIRQKDGQRYIASIAQTTEEDQEQDELTLDAHKP